MTVTKTIDASKYAFALAIGRQMENNYRQIIFNCAGFGVEVASIMLVHQRSQDTAPYIVAETTGEDNLTWTITNTDTAYAGAGKAELRISFTNGLAKSVVYTTHVIKSITGDTVIPAPLQSWYDAMIQYIDDHSVSPEQIDAAVAEYLEEHPVSAPVTSVNNKTGDVVLDASDVGALPDDTVIPTKTSQLQNDSGFLTSAPVQSVNGDTGDVVITAADLGAITSESDPVFSASAAAGITSGDITAWNGKYTKPSGGVPVSDLNSTVQSRLLKTGGTTGQVLAKKSNTNYDVEWQTVQSGGGAVDSVNGQTGTVVLDASDVGALPDTYTAPVSSVNSKTGAVSLSASDVGALPSSTTFVSSFNGSTGAVTYTAPVTSVNGQTGAVTVTDTDTTYSISISGNVITLTPSTGTAQTINLPADAVSSVDGKTGAVSVLPSGGSSGQVLSKASGTDYDVEWTTPQGGGGGSEWTLVNSVTLSEATNTITIDKDTNGNSFALKDVLVVYHKDQANDEGTNSAGKIKLVGQWGTFTYSFAKLNGGTFNDRLNEVTLKREYYSSNSNSIITCGAFNAGNNYDYSASFIGAERGMYPAIRIELTNDNNSVTFPVNTIVEVYTK